MDFADSSSTAYIYKKLLPEQEHLELKWRSPGHLHPIHMRALRQENQATNDGWFWLDWKHLRDYIRTSLGTSVIVLPKRMRVFPQCKWHHPIGSGRKSSFCFQSTHCPGHSAGASTDWIFENVLFLLCIWSQPKKAEQPSVFTWDIPNLRVIMTSPANHGAHVWIDSFLPTQF